MNQRAEKIEERIYAWLNEQYPEGPVWFEEDWPEERLPPIEVRMLYPMNAIEYNISNGGWSQFLWNCIYTWRALIETARQGYLLIGARTQAEALDTLYQLCESTEAKCLEALGREDGSMNEFSDFTSQSYAKAGDEWQSVFYGSEPYDARLRWLEQNEHRIRRIVGDEDA
jgi:hypothetical protein